ncbi:MAG: thymidylate synthase [Legionellales bacterium]|nr:thymidylate synthase [Legionellales bacterium]
MEAYLNFLDHIMNSGADRPDRTGTGIRSVFGYDMRFNLQEGFPLVTTKKCHFKSIVVELLWMLSGSTNVKDLNAQGVSIWDEWADENGDLGPVYGAQWRHWIDASGQVIDQIKVLLNELVVNPNSRRHIVSAWNVGALHQMALPPCHAFMQFYVSGPSLSCKLTQRSADAFLGVPFNIASYALLTHMIAAQVGLVPGEFIWSGGDCHIYHNHFDQVKLQCTRTPHSLPMIQLNPAVSSLFEYTFEDIQLINYIAEPHIRAEVAV